MENQHPLFDTQGPAPPDNFLPGDVVFFCLLLDAKPTMDVTELAHLLRHKHGLKGAPRTRHFHVSICDLDNCLEVPDWLDKARQVAASVIVPPFEIAFDHVASYYGRWKNSKPLVLCQGGENAALKNLYQELGQKLKSAHLIKKFEKKFNPHLTLLYDKFVDAHPIETVGWPVQEFVLVRRRKDEHHYVRLGSWQLSGALT